MKYESDILEMIHENAMLDFKMGFISEAEMREFDELCLPEEALQNNTAQGVTAPFESLRERKVAEALEATANIEHTDLITASLDNAQY